MLRPLGAVLLLGGSVWIGWQAGEELLEKTRNLRELIDGLEQMKRELSFRLTPLPVLLTRLGEKIGGPVGSMFRACGRRVQSGEEPFETSWKREVLRLEGKLDGRVLESLLRLGRGLGRCDWEEEERLLSSAVVELKEFLKESTEKNRDSVRLYRTLGTTAGIMLLILLL